MKVLYRYLRINNLYSDWQIMQSIPEYNYKGMALVFLSKTFDSIQLNESTGYYDAILSNLHYQVKFLESESPWHIGINND